MEGDTSDDFDFSSTWMIRSDKSAHISSLISWLCSENEGIGDADCFSADDGGNLGSLIEADKFKT